MTKTFLCVYTYFFENFLQKVSDEVQEFAKIRKTSKDKIAIKFGRLLENVREKFIFPSYIRKSITKCLQSIGYTILVETIIVVAIYDAS
jgi:hypothetical protein